MPSRVIHKFDPVPEDELKITDPKRYEIKRVEDRLLPYETKSICPECMIEHNKVNVIAASVYEEDGKVLMKKTCEEHGEWQDVYWSDAELFKRSMKYWYKSMGLDNPRTETLDGCPLDCGLCPEHQSFTALALLDVTNRCNLRCPICFASAADAGYVYEPTKEEVYDMMKNLRANRPVPTHALQFAGGEPTVSENLLDYIRKAKELGFANVQIATNGIRIGNSMKYAHQLKEAGLSTLYLQFDGMTSEPYIAARGVDLLNQKFQTVKNCREAGLHSIVLVPTLVRGINDHQVGDIIRYAVDNYDVIRCVNFQPVSITGRINHEERAAMRITIPDLVHLLDEQSNGTVKSEDWFPVPSMLPVGRAAGLLSGIPKLELSTHPACGMSTFIVVEDDGSFVPITHYISVDKFLSTLENVINDYAKDSRLSRTKGKARLLGATRHFKKKGMIKDLLGSLLTKGDYSSLADFMRRVIMIGSMHFMDPYNMDLERVQHCEIHYSAPDGRLIPFCAQNSIHRPNMEKQFSMSLEEWRQSKKRLTEVEKHSLTGETPLVEE